MPSPRPIYSPFPQRIPGHVLTAARDGPAPSVAKLISGLTHDNYTLEVVDLILLPLHPDNRTPPPPRPRNLHRMDPAEEQRLLKQLQQHRVRGGKALYCATEGLMSLLPSCPTDKREATITRILPQLDNLLEWYIYFLKGQIPQSSGDDSNVEYRNPSRPCTALLHLIAVDTSFNDRLLNSDLTDKVVAYAIAAWAARGPRTNEAYISFVMGHDKCPITQLLSTFLSSDDGRQRVFDAICYKPLYESKALRAMVIEGAVSRCRSVAQLSRKSVEDDLKVAPPGGRKKVPAVQAVLEYLHTLLIVVQKFSEDLVISRELMRSDFFEAICRALLVWVKKCRRGHEEAVPKQRAFIALAGIQGMIVLQSQRSATLWRLSACAVEGTVRGGYVELLVEGMLANPSKDAPDSKVILDTLELLKLQSGMHPSLAGPLSWRMRELYGDNYYNSSSVGLEKSSTYHKKWCSMAFDVLAASFSLDNGEFGRNTFICDNMKCPGDRRRFSPSLTCSNCHSMIYCSHECQKEDWSALHRDECAPARREYYQARHCDKPHYTQAKRKFHAVYTARRADWATMGLGDILHQEDIGVATQTPKAQPAIIELSLWRNLIHTIEEYIQLRGLSIQSNNEVPQYHLDKRICALLSSFTKEDADMGIRLVEGAYQFGNRTIFILAKLQEIPGEEAHAHELLYSIMKFD
ncbi:hypothetical protein DFP72DRAFT_1069395 [Ephemerocybe angulata]|uniref:MYND-type domain-containing protein n=1 Tax=Ephemerocybe angulata TaxID=980116 RepID=A0A8H6M540_9AGAR|nr:hypothetical protein DFP72DRAFT_1069395 [Tulosesus angulatus]